MKKMIFVLIVMFAIGGIFAEAQEKVITPEIRDQNINILYQSQQRHEQGLNNLALKLARLEFIAQHLTETKDFKKVMGEAEEKWAAYLKELEAKAAAEANKDTLIQQQQEEIATLRAKLIEEKKEKEDDKKDK